MKKIIKEILLVFCLVLGILCGSKVLGSSAYATEVGQKLLQPEAGWKRIDDSNKFLYYSSGWTKGVYDDSWYNKTAAVCSTANKPLTIKFKGTKFRIIGAVNNTKENNGSTSIRVAVDGMKSEVYNGHKNLEFQVLLYEKAGLEDKDHIVTIQSDTDNCIWMDAIDIPNDAVLLNANPIKVSSISLNKKEMTMNVEEVQNLTAAVLPIDTTDKSVTWTSSDTNVCIVDKEGKVTAVSQGNAVITVVANDGSGRSASANIKVVDNRRGVLTVNMAYGKQYKYDMTMPEINDFIAWYENRSEGQGKSYYVINTKPSLASYKSHADYLSFNNIADFSIDRY